MTMIQTEGTFDAEIVDRMLGTSKSEKPKIVLVCEVTEPGTEHKHQLPWEGYFTPAAMKQTMKTLTEACGFSGSGADIWEFVRCRERIPVRIVVESEPDNDGNPRLRIKWLNSTMYRASDDEQRKLADMLAGAIDAYSGSKGKPAAPPRDDEIPF